MATNETVTAKLERFEPMGWVFSQPYIDEYAEWRNKKLAELEKEDNDQ